MLPRHGARILGILLPHQWSHTRPRCEHIFRREPRFREERVGGTQQVDHVLRAGPNVLGRHRNLGLGGSDVADLTPGDDEHDSAVDGGGKREGFTVAEPAARHHHVDALGDV